MERRVLQSFLPVARERNILGTGEFLCRFWAGRTEEAE